MMLSRACLSPGLFAEALVYSVQDVLMSATCLRYAMDGRDRHLSVLFVGLIINYVVLSFYLNRWRLWWRYALLFVSLLLVR
jgi:hypothetical protein